MGGEFMGVQGECEFYLNTEFYDKSIDPQLIMSMVLCSIEKSLARQTFSKG
jgi:hypothetical protein